MSSHSVLSQKMCCRTRAKLKSYWILQWALQEPEKCCKWLVASGQWVPVIILINTCSGSLLNIPRKTRLWQVPFLIPLDVSRGNLWDFSGGIFFLDTSGSDFQIYIYMWWGRGTRQNKMKLMWVFNFFFVTTCIKNPLKPDIRLFLQTLRFSLDLPNKSHHT